MTGKHVIGRRQPDHSMTGCQLTLVFEDDAAPLHPAKAAALARRITPGWRDLASCSATKDPDAWFPRSRTDLARAGEAKRTCRGCPVRRECLAAALLRREAGIWGGISEADRDQALSALCRGATVDAVLDITLAAHAGHEDNLASAGAAA
jgi:WhiB family transcriptional regulator, redox-sensing transcriptional regulator